VPSPTQVSAFKKGMEIHAHYYATQAKLDVTALRIATIYGPVAPDFSDRPDGKLFEDDEADWTTGPT
jgi:nucleoside-diphosphate-sugar epimerase